MPLSLAASLRLPLRFVENAGQAHPAVRFHAAPDVLLTATGVVLVSGGATLRIEFDGANPSPLVRGLDPLAGQSNYLVGGDPARWRTGLPNYARVRYEGVYPGIDVVFYGNRDGRLEYDFLVAPGADPARVRLKLAGPRKPALDAGGDLRLGPFRLARPRAYQGARGVRCRYRLHPGGSVSFEVAAFDRRRPLVIDPVLDYSSYLGGSGGSVGESIAVDQAGYIYVTGATTSNNFPLVEPIQQFFYGSNEVFVVKLDPTGENVVYSTYLGSWGDDRGLDIAADAEGCAYVTGHTTSPDFPTAGPVRGGHRGGSIANGGDAFVLKLSPAGSELIFSRLIGGTGDEFARSIALDPEGNIWIVGSTTSLDYPIERPHQDFHGGATRDVFLTRLSADGSKLLYSTYLGGSGVDEGNSLALDPEGNVYITGTTTAAEYLFPLKDPIRDSYAGGARDSFVAKFAAEPPALVYSTLIGGTGDDSARSIAVDSDGSAYITGYTTNNNYPTTANRFKGHGGSRDAFITKLNPEGTEMVYSTFLGGSGTDETFGIALDAGKNIYVAGFTQSRNLPVENAFQGTIVGSCTTSSCTADLFIAKLNAEGSALIYSTYLGGARADQPRAIALDAQGHAVVTGYTASLDFPTVRPFQPEYNGGGTNIAFVVKLADE